MVVQEKISLKHNKIKIDEVQQSLNNHLTDISAHNIGDINLLKTTNKTTLVESVNEVVNNFVTGKTKIVSALNTKGQSATSTNTFDELSTKIKNIPTGYSVGSVLSVDKYRVNEAMKKELILSSIQNTDYDRIFIDTFGNIYCLLGEVLYKYSNTGSLISSVTIPSSVIGIANGRYDSISSITVDSSGYIYLMNRYSGDSKITMSGSVVWSNVDKTRNVNSSIFSGGLEITDNYLIKKPAERFKDYIYVINKDTGKFTTTTDLYTSYYFKSLFVSNNILVYLAGSGRLYGYNIDTKSNLWNNSQISNTYTDTSTMILSKDPNVFFLISTQYLKFFKLQVSTGSIISTTDLPAKYSNTSVHYNPLTNNFFFQSGNTLIKTDATEFFNQLTATDLGLIPFNGWFGYNNSINTLFFNVDSNGNNIYKITEQVPGITIIK